jgi:hypothetical protein
MKRLVRFLVGGVLVAVSLRGGALAASGPIIPQITGVSPLVVSTVPGNGDLNPYGVAFVPSGFPAGGPLTPGDILVSNFNNSGNLQGTGTTIVSIDQAGGQSLFFQGRPSLGLTTALGVLRKGFVIVGNVPTTAAGGPNAATCRTGPVGQQIGVSKGSLLILNAQGKVVRQLVSKEFLEGPWDLAVSDGGDTASVFVSNVLSGTVSRVDLAVGAKDVRVLGTTTIASGYLHRCDPAALVVGPTGLALDPGTETLYVASTGDNVIYAVSNAFGSGVPDKGTAFITDDVHLHGPLGLVRAENGNLITSQGDAVNSPSAPPFNEIVEYGTTPAACTPNAAPCFLAQMPIDPQTDGSAFGIALSQSGDSFVFAAVDDGQNTLNIWNVP